MPVFTATGAGVRNRRRWLFRDLDVTVDPGELAVIVGPPGSGRTTLLLALADRFQLSAGSVRTRGTIALGHVAGVHEPEPMFTVAEHVRERLLLLGRPRAGAGAVLESAGLDAGLPGWQLSPYQRQLLGLALARIGDPRLIALDGVDDGLDRAEQAALWHRLAEIAATGVAVLATAREVDPGVPSTVIRLGGPADPLPPSSPPSSPLRFADDATPEQEDER